MSKNKQHRQHTNALQALPGKYDYRMLARDAGVLKSVQSVIAQLTMSTQMLTKKDIDKWRKAWQQAINIETPRRLDLYNVYTDCLIDNHLSGAIGNRKISVLKKKFKITDAKGNENEELTVLFKSPWFKQFCDLALDAKFWGHSLIQFNQPLTDPVQSFASCELVPRHHVVPEFGVIITNQTDEPKKGTDYRTPPIADWCIEVGDPKDLGLLLKVAPQAIAKRNQMAFWDNFAELFGMPIRIGTTNSRDKREIDRMETMLANMGSAAYGLFQDGTEIKVVESSRGDAFNVYDKRIERANSEISKAILGQTMTMDNGSSQSQSIVHERVAEDITNNDASDLADIINSRLFPFLIKHGWNLTGAQYQWDDTYEFSPQEMINIEAALLNNFDIDPQYFADKYNIPIVGLKQNGTPSPITNAFQKKKSELSPFTNVAQCPHCGGNHLTMSAQHLPAFDVDAFLKQVWEDPTNMYSFDFFNYTQASIIDGFVRGWLNKASNTSLAFPFIAEFDGLYDISKLDLDYSIDDRVVIQKMEENIFRFSASKSLEVVNKLNAIVTETKSFDAFKNRAIDEKLIDRYNAQYLQTEYNFAWAVGQNAANYQRMIGLIDTYPTWVYRTQGDLRVREAHQVLDGRKFKAGEKGIDPIYPPNGWGCRCYMQPAMEVPDKYDNPSEAIKSLGKEYDRMKADGFAINRAKTAEVYDANKMYVKDVLGVNMGIKHNGLMKLDAINEIAPVADKNERLKVWAENWYKANVVKEMVTDYAGRLFKFTQDTVDYHLTEIYLNEGRQNIIEFVPKILENPDEVWLWKDNSNGKVFYNYIRFYKDLPLMVQVETESMGVYTWFEIRKADVDLHKRTGTLIKAKTFNH